MKKCSKCGTEYPDKAEYCRKDGTKLTIIEVEDHSHVFWGSLLQLLAIAIVVIYIILLFVTEGKALPLAPFVVSAYYLNKWGEKLGGSVMG